MAAWCETSKGRTAFVLALLTACRSDGRAAQPDAVSEHEPIHAREDGGLPEAGPHGRGLDASRDGRALDAGSVVTETDLPAESANASARRDAAPAEREAAPGEPSSPSDAGGRAAPDAAIHAAASSCYGRCGSEALLAIAGACACDVGCLARGDCCSDKHELCAASRSSALCALTGNEGNRAACGSDLGWSFVHDGAQEIFFGDSYDESCAVPLLYDDAQGRLPLARPASIPDRATTQPVACTGVLELDLVPGRETFAPMRLFEQGRALSSWLLETPLTGFSDGRRVFTISRRGTQIGPLYLAMRDGSAANVRPERTVYRVLMQFGTTHFQNLTATSVARFEPDHPERSDYRDGVHGLLLFGRDQFHGPSARKLYLAHQSLPFVDDAGQTRFAPSYFAGLADGRPRWSELEADAQPILDGDFTGVMQHDVAYVPELKRWLMLYGGDVADALDGSPNDQPRHGAIHMRMAPDPWGPWSEPAPLLFREHAARFLHCDAPRMPPSGAAAGCDLDELPSDPERSYSTGEWGPSWRDFADCRTDMPEPRQPALTPGSGLPCPGTQRGNLYAPNLLLPWTVDRAGEHGYTRAATLYFNVSTWYPYQVVLAAADIHLP